ncbi:MAG: hypothetical protein ACREMQ_08975 [Longimicrobiales bacterium]
MAKAETTVGGQLAVGVIASANASASGYRNRRGIHDGGADRDAAALDRRQSRAVVPGPQQGEALIHVLLRIPASVSGVQRVGSGLSGARFPVYGGAGARCLSRLRRPRLGRALRNSGGVADLHDHGSRLRFVGEHLIGLVASAIAGLVLGIVAGFVLAVLFLLDWTLGVHS